MARKSPRSTSTVTSASARTVSAFIRYSRVTLRASRIAISLFAQQPEDQRQQQAQQQHRHQREIDLHRTAAVRPTEVAGQSPEAQPRQPVAEKEQSADENQRYAKDDQ